MSMLNEAKRGSLTDDRDRSLKGRLKEYIPWKGDGILEILRKIVFLGAMGFLVYYAYDAYIYNFGSKSMKDDQQNLANLFNTPSVTSAAEQDPGEAAVPDKTPSGGDGQEIPDSAVDSKYPAGMLPNFESLYDINPDIVGWIVINGIYVGDSDDELAINYGVVQSDDNDYYLSHDFFGAEEEHGALYADYRAVVGGENRSSNVTIYGHNMKVEAFFHHLRDYNRFTTGFVSEHRLVDFTTLYEHEQYIIIGCFLVSTEEEDDNQPLFRYHNAVEFNTIEDFDYWYKNILYRNYFKTDIDCNMDDKYLTLSTCSFEISDSRFVVVARKLREGEDPDAYSYVSNPKRHMPVKWYKAMGYDVPKKDDGPDYEYYTPEEN